MSKFKPNRRAQALAIIGVVALVATTGVTFVFTQLHTEEAQSDNREVQLGKLSDNFQQYLESKSGDEIVKVFISLTPANLEGVESDNVVNVLQAHANETQGPILEFLEGENAEVINTFWLGNGILADVTANTVYELTSFSTVERVCGWFELPVGSFYGLG